MKLCNKIIKTMIVIAIVIAVSTSSTRYITTLENTNINKTVNLSTMAMQITYNEDAKIYTPLSSFGGELTGYVYNCPLCTGRLACMSSLDLSGGRTTYEDAIYGEVRIVASSSNLPCGSIITFDSNRIDEDTVFAIVLDRGVLGTDLDLLVESLDEAISTVGRSSINYDVLRTGWGA